MKAKNRPIITEEITLPNTGEGNSLIIQDRMKELMTSLYTMNRKQRRRFASTRKIPWAIMPKFTKEQAESSKTWNSEKKVKKSRFSIRKK